MQRLAFGIDAGRWQRTASQAGRTRMPLRWNQSPQHRNTPCHAEGNEQIHERNGIWVVTIGGIWLGDYIKREHAIAAVKTAVKDGR